MSSKVLPPERAASGAPVVWRQVRQDAGRRGPPQAAGRGRRGWRRWSRNASERVAARPTPPGCAKGKPPGGSAAAAELQPVMERLARSIEEIGGLRARLRREAEADLVELALAIARRVLRREMAVDPDALHGLVLAALEKLQGQEIRRVRVHPSHAALLSACLRGSPAGRQSKWCRTRRASRATVIFETERGNLDASVESQLQEIERGLADRLRRTS